VKPVVFQREVDDGLRDAVLSSGTLAMASVATPCEPFPTERWRKRLERAVGTNLGQPDLFYLKTVLVSTGWNKNDDVFDQAEVWAARHTPEDKPFNYEHDCADIIGHMTECYASGEEGAIDDSLPVDALPRKFDIVTQAVVYKLWPKRELQERMDRILAEVAEGKWFVSMEAYFRGFDYAMVSAAGDAKVVLRDKDTSFLTRHLKCYGGEGEYDGWRIGRLLRDITFSGKGLVRNPANPDSVILSHAREFCAGVGYFTSPKEHVKDMPKDTDAHEGEIESLKATLESQAKTLADEQAASAQAKAQAKQAAEELAQANSELEAVRAQLAEAQKQAAEAAARADKLEKELSAAEERFKAVGGELESLKASKKKSDRERLASDKLGLDAQKAARLVENAQAMTDEQFAAHVEVMAELKGEKPAETKGAKVAESDPAAAAADPGVISRAEENKEPALAGGKSGVNDLRLTIAKHFGYTETAQS
jgi:chemotaxis protein histidine kinase CheA